MKTLVLQLDRTEDAGSIRDKVTWGKASRVLLVWPVNFALLDRKIDLVSLKRICASQGSRLGVVCDIPEIIAEADELQIPVFESVNRAMRKSWDRRRGRKPGGSSPFRESGNSDIEQLRIEKFKPTGFWEVNKNISVLLFLTAILAVFAILIFLFPSARVSIFPQGRSSEIRIEFRVLETEGNTSTPGLLAATQKSITVNGATTVPTTGNLMVPDQSANGTLTVVNLTSAEVTIPAGTIVYNPVKPAVRYRILGETRVPAEESFSQISVAAVEPGEAGNSDENTITSLDGLSGLQVEIFNPDPVTGGSSKTYQAVAEDDVSVATEKLQKILTDQAEVEFAKTLTDQEIILPSSLQIVKVVDQTEQPEKGQAGVLLKLDQTVDCSVLVINRLELERQAESILDSNQPTKGWSGSSKKPAEVQILSQEFDPETKTVILEVFISKMLIPPLDTRAIRDVIAGKSITRATEFIDASVLNAKPPEIHTTPGWLPFLPLLSSRIQVEVQ